MRPIYDSYRGDFPCDGLTRTGWADARRRKNRQFASLARSTAPTDLRGRIERGLRDGGRRAGPSQGMSDMDGRALRASAITPDGRHPGRTARHPFWPFCGGRDATRRIYMHGEWTECVPMHCIGGGCAFSRRAAAQPERRGATSPCLVVYVIILVDLLRRCSTPTRAGDRSYVTRSSTDFAAVRQCS